MPGPGDLHAFAEALLDACVEALDTIPIYEPDLFGAPERQIISPGTPVWDCCEQLAVHVPLVGEAFTTPGGLDAGRRASRARINHVSVTATITRCVPTGAEGQSGDYQPPTPAALSAAAEQIHADGWALFNHLFNMKSSAELLTLCDEMFFDGVIAVVPSGGCAGWTVPVRAVIDGYNELLGS